MFAGSGLFLWAVQRYYEVRRHAATGEEIREDRYLKLLWPQIGEIHDLDFGPTYGTHFTQQRPLLLEERFGGSGRKKICREYRSPKDFPGSGPSFAHDGRKIAWEVSSSKL